MGDNQSSEHELGDLPDEVTRSDAQWIRKGVRASDAEIERLQSRFEVSEQVAILADLGHHLTATEVVTEAKESIDAGASALHLHIKEDEDTRNRDKLSLWREVIGEIRDDEPDVVIDGGFRGDTYEESMDFIREGLFDVVTFELVSNPDYIEPALEVIREHSAKPRLTVFDTSDILLAKNVYIEPGLVETPALWSVMLGNPYKGLPMSDPIEMARGLSFIVEHIKKIDPGAEILVTASGIPSSYLTGQAILLGEHVRLGMGETRWKYPHKGDRLTSNVEAIEDAVSVARGLGRTPATPSEFREMIGLSALK